MRVSVSIDEVAAAQLRGLRSSSRRLEEEEEEGVGSEDTPIDRKVRDGRKWVK